MDIIRKLNQKEIIYKGNKNLFLNSNLKLKIINKSLGKANKFIPFSIEKISEEKYKFIEKKKKCSAYNKIIYENFYNNKEIRLLGNIFLENNKNRMKIIFNNKQKLKFNGKIKAKKKIY